MHEVQVKHEAAVQHRDDVLGGRARASFRLEVYVVDSSRMLHAHLGKLVHLKSFVFVSFNEYGKNSTLVLIRLNSVSWQAFSLEETGGRGCSVV